MLIYSVAGAVFADSLLRALGGEKGIIVRSFDRNVKNRSNARLYLLTGTIIRPLSTL